MREVKREGKVVMSMPGRGRGRDGGKKEREKTHYIINIPGLQDWFDTVS